MIIYLDESGDLGFGAGGTKYFVILFVVANDEIALKRHVRRVKKKHKIPRDVEIKATTSSPGLRMDILRSIAQTDIEVYSITTYKPGVHERLRSDTNILYNYAIGLLLIPYLVEKAFERVSIVVDQRITRISRGLRFDDYIRTELWGRYRVYTDIRIHHLDSRESLGLQAVDFVSNALFRARERNEWGYWNLVRDKAKDTKRLFF